MTRASLSVRWCFGLLIGLAWAPTVRAEVTALIGATPTDFPSGQTVPVTIYFLNRGADPVAFAPPDRLEATLTANGNARAVTLRGTPTDAAADRVPTGAFRERVYQLDVPAGVSGPATLQLSAPPQAVAGGPAAAISVTGPNTSPATPGTPITSTPATAAAPEPPVVGPGNEPLPNEPALPPNDSGIAEAILPRFSPHEPIYFLVGPDRPNAKFQVSFKYQVLNPEGSWSQTIPPLSGLHLAYSQTSFWDLEDDSAPFLDSSYRPEVLWSAKDWRIEDSVVSRVGFQLGLMHESNGRDGGDSRSLNTFYIRPSVTFGDPEGMFVTFAPRMYTYVFGMDATNDNIADYRGHFDLRLIAGERDGLQLAVIGRVGDDWDKGSVQFDLSYPMRRFFNNNVDLYLHAQYFTGYGESLLGYDEYTNRWRVGVSIVR